MMCRRPKFNAIANTLRVPLAEVTRLEPAGNDLPGLLRMDN